MQQGNHNKMMPASSVAAQESIDTETQDSDSETDYEVTENIPKREFDPETLNALGVVGRSDSADSFADETCEKQVVSAAEHGTSQCMEGREHQQGVENADAEDTVRKGVDFDVALQTDVRDDGDDDDDDDDANRYYNNGQGGIVSNDDQSVSAKVQVNGAAGLLLHSQELLSVYDVKLPTPRVTEDSDNVENLLDVDPGSAAEAMVGGELLDDTFMLPASPSMQQEPPIISDDHDGLLASINSRHSAGIQSWLYSIIVCTTKIAVYMYVNHYARL